MNIFKTTLLFLISFIFFLTSCQKSSEFETPSKYVYSHTKPNGQKTFVIDANKQITEIPNNIGSFKLANKTILDSVNAVVNNIYFNIVKFNFFAFKTDSEISVNITDLFSGSTSDMTGPYTRDGSAVIIDGDDTFKLRLSDDFDELSLCSEVLYYVHKSANGTSGSATDFTTCTSLSFLEAVNTFLVSIPNNKIDTISITYYNQVFKKQ